MNPTRGNNSRMKLHLGHHPAAPSLQLAADKENLCTRPPACSPVFPTGRVQHSLFSAPNCRWTDAKWRTFTPRSPGPHRSLVLRRPHRPENHSLPSPAAARSLATAMSFPAISAMHVAGAAALRPDNSPPRVLNKQERVIAGGLEVAVVGALLLLAVDRNSRSSPCSSTTRCGNPRGLPPCR